MQWNPPRKYKGYRTPHVHAIKITIPSFEYRGGRSLGAWTHNYSYHTELAAMEQWCEDNCRNNWSSMGYSTWYFDKPQEALMFKMIFGGRS